jgi:proteasome beta subunit
MYKMVTNFLWKIIARAFSIFKENIEMRETSNQLVLKGTTTVGVICSDGVILSSDTRVTMGNFVAHKKGKKIYKIDDHIAMTISGSVADAQQVVDILTANAQLYKMNFGRPIPIKAASRLIANLLFSSRYAPLIAQILIGGVDDTGSHVFSLDPLGSLTEEKCVATGSGSPVAYGVLEDKYQEGVPTKELLPIVVHAVKAAMKRNTASGDSFDVTIIDKEGYHELSDEEKNDIAESMSETRRKV